MARSRYLRPALLLLCAAVVAISAQVNADAALVKVGDLVLRADGSFKPAKLSRHRYEPIDIFGHVDVHSTTGGPPTPLQEAVISFDHNGKLETDGLPVCKLSQIKHATTAGARSKCKGAIVGSGTVGAMYNVLGIEVEVNIPATLFNGGRQNGDPIVIGHLHTTLPTDTTYTVVIALERLQGAFGYRAQVDVPQIAGGGVFTHIDGKIGARYFSHGHERSYVNGRCPAGVLRIHGHFLFGDGTIIDGQVEKPCFPEN